LYRDLPKILLKKAKFGSFMTAPSVVRRRIAASRTSLGVLVIRTYPTDPESDEMPIDGKDMIRYVTTPMTATATATATQNDEGQLIHPAYFCL
jgi:hypothetical protein